MTAVRAAGYTSSLTRGELEEVKNIDDCYRHKCIDLDLDMDYCRIRCWFVNECYCISLLPLLFKNRIISLLPLVWITTSTTRPDCSCLMILNFVFLGSTFDPLGQSRGPAPPLEAKNEDTWVTTYEEFSYIIQSQHLAWVWTGISIIMVFILHL